MPTQPYLIDGVRVPGVTTILSRFKESGGLIHWGWNTAYCGLVEARSILERAANDPNYQIVKFHDEATAFVKRPLTEWDYRAKRDTAADAGTIAHEMMDCFVHKREFNAAQYEPHLIELAKPAFEAFLAWAQQSKFGVIETETPLVSRKYRFGGTRDAILIDGKRAMGDWKTSNRIYPEYLMQLAAYAILDEEAGNKIDGGFHLLKFSKQEQPDDPVRFAHFYWAQLDLARESFLLCRQLYDNMKRLEGMAR